MIVTLVGPRDIRALAQKFARSRQRDRNDGDARGDRGFKSAQLEGANAVVRGECAFGKDEDGLAAAKKFFHLFGLTEAGILVGAFEPEMTHLLQERSDKRHVQNFSFGDEAIRDAEAKHDAAEHRNSWCDLRRRF